MLNSIASSNELFLDSLNKNSLRMQRAQQEISTGKRLVNVSDDPDQVSALLQAQAELASNQTITGNLGRVKLEVDNGEQALQSAVAVMERVRTLGSQGVTGTASPQTRQALAGEIGSLLEQLGGISRTQVEGRYIFSGDSDQAPPYTIDLTQANPVSGYGGSPATRQIQHPNGTRFSVARTAQQIFDAPAASDNVFYSVSNLRQALLNNDDAAIKSAFSDIGTSLDYLNGQLTFYGTAQNKVQEATDMAQQRQVQLNTRLSVIQDADLTQAITEFQQAAAQQQVSLESRAKMPRSTLFDYLG